MAKKGKKARQRARQQAARKRSGATATKPTRPAPSSSDGAKGSVDTRRAGATTDAPAKRPERLVKRETARLAKVEAARQRQRARRRKRIMTYSLVGLVILTAGGFGIFRYFEGNQGVRTAAAAAGCTPQRSFDIVGRTHVDAEGTSRTPYNSEPPTSGDHLGAQILPWGSVYEEPHEPEIYVHNLEHGGTVVHYSPELPDGQIEPLHDLADKYPRGILMLPNDTLDKRVVMTSWGKMQSCDDVSATVIEAFVKRNCNKSPELAAECGGLVPVGPDPGGPGS